MARSDAYEEYPQGGVAPSRRVLAIGDRMVDFTLLAGMPDGTRAEVRSDALAEGLVLLHFFPLAFTRVCTAQMCETRDAAAALDALGVKVFGFSCDSAPANAAFAKDLGLAHPIVADPNREVVEVLWETQTVVRVHRVPKRGWMLLRDGVVASLWITDDAGTWCGLKPVEDAVAALGTP